MWLKKIQTKASTSGWGSWGSSQAPAGPWTEAPRASPPLLPDGHPHHHGDALRVLARWCSSWSANPRCVQWVPQSQLSLFSLSYKAGLNSILKGNQDGIRPHHFMANGRGKCGSSVRFPLLGLSDHRRWWWQARNQKTAALGRKVMTNRDSLLWSWDITLPRKVCIVKAMVFPVIMDHIKGWTPNNWCFSNCGVGEDSWKSLGLRPNQST